MQVFTRRVSVAVLRFWGLWGLLGLVCLARVASAQPGPDPGLPEQPPSELPDPEARARAVFEDAKRHLDAGDYEAALLRYQIAYELSPRAKTLLNIATLLFELGREVEAANAYAVYLRMNDTDREKIPKVKEVLAELDKKLERLALQVYVARGTVFVGDVKVGAAPLQTQWRVAPGAHSITVRDSDTTSHTAAATVLAGAVEVVRIGAAPASVQEQQPLARSLGEASRGYRFAAFVRADVDLTRAGAIGAIGGRVRLAQHWHVFAGGLLGARFGGELGLSWEPLSAALRLRATLAAPILLEDGARAGGRLTLGVVWGHRFRTAAEIGVAYHPSTPEDYANAVVLGSLGIELGL